MFTRAEHTVSPSSFVRTEPKRAPILSRPKVSSSHILESSKSSSSNSSISGSSPPTVVSSSSSIFDPVSDSDPDSISIYSSISTSTFQVLVHRSSDIYMYSGKIKSCFFAKSSENKNLML